jgi:hypothetical protein
MLALSIRQPYAELILRDPQDGDGLSEAGRARPTKIIEPAVIAATRALAISFLRL